MRTILIVLSFFITTKIFSQTEIPFQTLIGATDFAVGYRGFQCSMYIDTLVIRNEKDFDTWAKSCKWEFEKPDFSKQIIIAASYGSDCHMQIEPHVFKDDTAKTITLRTINKWGGCRAGGWREVWLLIDNPGDDYTILFNEVQTDLRDERD